MSPRTIANIDDYIAAAPPDVRPVLQEIRTIVQDAVPDAEETMSYRMPAFKRGRTFVYFAAFKHHVGVFPPVKADPNLEKALRPYRGDKGNLKFPLDRPIPYDLIRRVVKALAAQHATP